MKTRLDLYFKWGIKFLGEYAVPEKGERIVEYAGRADLFRRIEPRPHKAETAANDSASGTGISHEMSQETINKMKDNIKEAQNELRKSE